MTLEYEAINCYSSEIRTTVLEAVTTLQQAANYNEALLKVVY